jgi:two-component system, LytTR family, sensor kinase
MKKSVIILIHIGYWALYLILILLILGMLNMGSQMKITSIIFTTQFLSLIVAFAIIPAVLGFYSFYILLFDKYLIQKKILLLFLFGILAAWLSGLIAATSMEIMSLFKLCTGIFNDGFDSAFAITNAMAIVALLNGGMGLLIKGFIKWFADIKLKEDLNKKNFDTELALIKSQINPHFLFNTINNIDILIEKNPVKASNYLNKLSDIMRFMLYETKTEKIALNKELNYIEKYIELQKIRTTNSEFVSYKIEGNTEGSFIAPMIFIPFIENAFKHAEGIKIGNAISIKIVINTDLIQFNCINKYVQNASKGENNGLGNELIKRRLALLYPNKHSLKINDDNFIYSVELDIKNVD